MPALLGYFGSRGAFRAVPEREKARAKNAVAAAIRRGDLVRPDVCSRCPARGRTGLGAVWSIQAHHGDYSRPLDVVWLCSDCHFAEHARLNAEASDGLEMERHRRAREQRRVRLAALVPAPEQQTAEPADTAA